MSENTRSAALRHTPLYDLHLECGAKIVDFGGWALPVHYGSQLEEHLCVRSAAGMFDVSHMTVTDIRGTDTVPFLRKLLANDIARVSDSPGKALYSCLLNDTGGIIDDLIVYHEQADLCRMVTNAATRDKDLAWLKQQAEPWSVDVVERPELAIIAVQGPAAREKAASVFPSSLADSAIKLPRFRACGFEEWYVGRTGYTGEDGFEVILPAEEAPGLWQKLVDAGVQPCGLGARDTLRLEAGMSLYGSDLSEEYTPLDSGLAWTVALDDPERNFIGRGALLKQLEEKSAHTMSGLVLESRGILRGHQQLFINDQLVGEVTSGTFSPTLQISIAMARLSRMPDGQLEVEIRGKRARVRSVKYPFVRNGKSCIDSG